MAAVTALAPGQGVITAACVAVGLARATYHRPARAAARPPPVRRPRPAPARALPAEERQGVLDVLREPRFVDQAPAEVWAKLLADLGVTKSHSRPYTSDDNPFSES